MFDPVAVFEAQSGFGEVEESRGVCDAGPDHSRQEVEEGFLAHPDEQVGQQDRSLLVKCGVRFAVGPVDPPDRTDAARLFAVHFDALGVGLFAAGVPQVLQGAEFGERFVQPVMPGLDRGFVPPEMADFMGGISEYILVERPGIERNEVFAAVTARSAGG